MEFLQNNFLSDFFVLCMKGLDSVFGNYAIAIIVLTLLIRMAMFPLDAQMRKNQRKMADIGPEMQSLQKRYANNPQQLQRKQRELQHKVGYRPMLGCLPMLIQLPFLFAFFGAMRVLASEQMVGMVLDAAQYGIDTVQLPSFLWVHNFWQPDSGFANVMPNATEFASFLQMNTTNITPETMSLLRSFGIVDYSNGVMEVPKVVYENYAAGIMAANGMTGLKNGWFILPLMCGGALLLQQKFAPQANSTGSPMMGAMPGAGDDDAQKQAQGCNQKVMMWVMPLFSIYICAQPSSTTAFALYWFTSSIYAFAQIKLIGAINKRRDKKQEVIVT